MKKTAEEILKAEFVDGEWEELMSYMNTDITPSIVRAMEVYADQFKPEWIEGYVETLKADLKYSIDLQEQQINESLNRGREEGIKYALEMLVMHLPSAPERKESTDA